MGYSGDVKNCISIGRLKETSWTCLDYVDEDCCGRPQILQSLTLTEAVNMAENQPLWRLLAASQHGSEPATLEAPGSVHS